MQFVSSTSSELRVADRLASGRGITANIGFNYLTFPETGSQAPRQQQVLINVTLGSVMISCRDTFFPSPPPTFSLGLLHTLAQLLM